MEQSEAERLAPGNSSSKESPWRSGSRWSGNRGRVRGHVGLITDRDLGLAHHAPAPHDLGERRVLHEPLGAGLVLERVDDDQIERIAGDAVDLVSGRAVAAAHLSMLVEQGLPSVVVLDAVTNDDSDHAGPSEFEPTSWWSLEI